MFKLNEILKATQGKLIAGALEAGLGGVSLDSRTIKKGGIFIAFKGDNFDGHDFIPQAIQRGAGCIIAQKFTLLPKSPGLALIKVADTKRALGDIAAYHRRRFDLPLIAVSGCNGKTTAKEMIAWVLAEKYRVLKNEGTKNNQIGLPMALLNLNSSHQAAVLEVGTNHFGEVKYLADICQPNIGVITNIGPAHLEYFGSLKGVLREKYSLILGLTDPYLAILNRDDSFLRSALLEKSKRPFALGFGFDAHSDFRARDVKYAKCGLGFRVNQKEGFFLKTPGKHNIYNALIAIAVARILGMPYRDIASRLACFDFPPGRLKLITRNKVNFLDDTYNANPLSLKEALAALANFPAKGRRIFIMGDMRELGRRQKDFHYQAGRDVAAVCDVFITVGKLSRLAAEAARKSGLKTDAIFVCQEKQEARKILLKEVSPGSRDIVLVKGSRVMKMEEVL